ncbi:Uncharacterised protein [Serratia rubidaea]|uniref:Uncharacterized protein n=1 Tax=Serratia rubidaea TaxID=61652 RepID=A0A3S4GD05_SERRU|nr:Uncharacterised protein [Serratia rubidaea]
MPFDAATFPYVRMYQPAGSRVMLPPNLPSLTRCWRGNSRL